MREEQKFIENGLNSRMPGHKKTVFVFTIAIIFCVLIVSTVSLLETRYEKEIAFCQTLDNNGISSAEADYVVRAINALSGTEDMRFFMASEYAAEVDCDVWGNALIAYGIPKSVKNKSIFSCLKYLSAIRRVNTENVELTENSILNRFNPVQKKDFVFTVVALAKGIKNFGKTAHIEFVDGIKEIKAAESFTEIPYKTLYNSAKYLIDITEQINVEKLSFLDIFFGEKFCENAKDGINVILNRLRLAEFSDFVAVAEYYPDIAALVVVASKFIFTEGGIESVARACAFFAEDGSSKFAVAEFSAYFEFLISLNPDELTDEERVKISACVNRLEKVFKSIVKSSKEVYAFLKNTEVE